MDASESDTKSEDVLFEGQLRLQWVGVENTAAVRVDQCIIQGPSQDRFRLTLGQVIDPIVVDEAGARQLRERGFVNVRPVSVVEFGPEQAREIFRLLERHFRRAGILEEEEPDDVDSRSS